MPLPPAVTLAALVLIAAQSQTLPPRTPPPAPMPSTAPTPPTTPPPPPSAWTVIAQPDRPAVRLGSTAKDGATRFAGGCEKGFGPGVFGSISGYRGGELSAADGQVERVLFEVRGAEWKDAFAVQLRYSARKGSWDIVKPLAKRCVYSAVA